MTQHQKLTEDEYKELAVEAGLTALVVAIKHTRNYPQLTTHHLHETRNRPEIGDGWPFSGDELVKVLAKENSDGWHHDPEYTELQG